jgi:hypothetical protein
MKSEQTWLSTTLTAAQFGVSAATVMRWRTTKGFPDAAVRYRGAVTEYHTIRVTAWLRDRPPPRRRPYKWQADGATAP